MARCDVCGNDYDLAPACGHCGCRIVGHGVEADGSMFCCAHCAREEGVSGLADRSA
jgi:hypothetical protein